MCELFNKKSGICTGVKCHCTIFMTVINDTITLLRKQKWKEKYVKYQHSLRTKAQRKFDCLPFKSNIGKLSKIVYFGVEKEAKLRLNFATCKLYHKQQTQQTTVPWCLCLTKVQSATAL